MFASVLQDVKALDAAITERNAIGSANTHLPMLSARSKSINLVAKVTVQPAPISTAGDAVEYVYLKDASGSVLAASQGPGNLIASIDKGKQVIPVVKYKLDGCWEGGVTALAPGFSGIE